MLAAVFIAGGLDVLANPEPRAKVAKPVVDKVAADVATNSYCRTCSGQGLLKYSCHTAAAKLAPQQF